MALFSRRSALQRSYDAVAADFAREYASELEERPADRLQLQHFAAAFLGAGSCVDIGCGPGHVAAFLRQSGLDISGIDISRGMVRQARRLYPDVRFQQGDMREIDATDHQWAAAVSRYALNHVPGGELQRTLLEFRRVIEPGGALLLAFASGVESRTLDTWWGHSVELEFHLHPMMDMLVHLQQAGFREVSVKRRRPYPGEPFGERVWLLLEAVPGVPPARRGRALLQAT